MKILRVIASMDPASGGPCQGIRNAIPELKKLGVENEVVCLDSPDNSFAKNDPFIIHTLGPSAGPWQKSQKLEPWLLDNLQRFDVVVIHGLWLYHGFAVRKCINRLSHSKSGKLPKWFVMPHGMLDPYFQKASGRKLKALRNLIYWKFIESKIINESDGVLFTTQAELELARQSFSPYQPKKELNVGYGIAAPPALSSIDMQGLRDAHTFLNDSNYLLFLSRIHEKKGVDLLMRAYASILKENSKGKLTNTGMVTIPKLVIAGPGIETDFGQSILKMVSGDVLLASHVIFAGMLMGHAKWAAFYSSGAFVLPSHQENFGISVAESLATGHPVLISDQVNIYREILESHAGLVSTDSEAGIYDILKRYILLSIAEKEALKANALSCFEKHFTIEAAARQFASVVN